MLATALVTPFVDGGTSQDLACVQRLVAFQLAHGADRVLLAGTTGEGVALDEAERVALLDAALEVAQPDQLMLSIGGGRLDQVICRGAEALQRGVRNLLLADPAYARPSSAALRTAWHGPIARALGQEARLVVYTVPSRTASELLPEDLARLAEDHPCVVGVKDATGRLSRMARVRQLCGPGFELLCGDEMILCDSLLDPALRAQGAISFAANLAPSLLAELVRCGLQGDAARCRVLQEALDPLASLVSVTTDEALTLRGRTLALPQRAPNPVPIKAALGLLGVVDEACRPPLASLGESARAQVRAVLRQAWLRQREWLAPLGADFGLDFATRLDASAETSAASS